MEETGLSTLQPQVFLPVIRFTFFLVRLPAIPAA